MAQLTDRLQGPRQSGWMTDCFAILGKMGGTALLLLGTAVSAQTYPVKPVRVIVPFSPGGGSDVIARLVGPKLSARLGQPVVIVNQPAASGVVGTDTAAKAQPDGHTLLLITSTHAVNARLATALPYDLIRDFAPITLVTSSPFGLMLQPAVPATSIKDFIAYAKANPGKLNYGSSGPGSSPHLATELFMSMTGITMTHIPYKGVAQYVGAQLGNEIQFSFGNLFSTMGHWKAGRLLLLAHGGAKRLEVFPELPTVGETVPGFEAFIWYGFVAPARTPPALVARLQSEIAAVINSPDMRQFLVAQGNDVVASMPDAFAKVIKTDVERWGALGKRLGVKLD